MADVLTAGNPRAHRVRVYYDGSSTIVEGMPVCYNYLITDNWFGGSVSDAGVVSATTTTAEGSHNESKYIHVCNPAVAAGDSITPSSTSKLITGGGDDFDALQVGMFVAITGTHVTNGNYKITAHNIAGDTITLDMTAATGATADVTVDMDNLHAFAGVVSKGGWCGKTGPQILDIYIPNGAIVPVKTVLTATVVGRTILAINSGTQTFGNPTEDIPSYGSTAGNIDGRSVAIAEETIAAAGLLLARLDPTMFIYQGGQIGSELQVGGAVRTAVNRINLDFAQTGAQCCATHYRSLISGTGANVEMGMYRFETFVTGSGFTNSITCLSAMLEIDTVSTADASALGLFGIKSTVRTRGGDPKFGDEAVAPLMCEWIMTASGGGTVTSEPTRGSMIYFNSDSTGTDPNYFLYFNTRESGAFTYDISMTPNYYGGLKICMAGIDCYIPVFSDLA